MNKPPFSQQNPILGIKKFYEFSKKRFDYIGHNQKNFKALIDLYENEGLFQPVCTINGKKYYSSFQIYILHSLENIRLNALFVTKETLSNEKVFIRNWKDNYNFKKETLIKNNINFNKLLKLLIEIQDIYLPEARGNNRYGCHMNYNGQIALEGTFFVNKKEILISELRSWRENLIKSKQINLENKLKESGLNIKDLIAWIKNFSLKIKSIDPLESWRLLIKYMNYSKKQKLKGDALIANDFYEIYEILVLFIQDLNYKLKDYGISDAIDLFDISQRKDGIPIWKVKKYGDYLASNPFKMMTYLTNDFGINPHPRSIIFTEGDEWKGIKEIFKFYNIDPELLGIEFRSIQGGGNFSFANWECFIEYMHEKQILIYFILDNENKKIISDSRRLLTKKRKFKYEPLIKIVPKKNRFKIWGERSKTNSSFEESNFTDNEISKVINKIYGLNIEPSEVETIRKDRNRTKGLIKEIFIKNRIPLNEKGSVAIELVKQLINRRKKQNYVKNKRPIEKYILTISKDIIHNDIAQPTGKVHQENNLYSRMFG